MTDPLRISDLNAFLAVHRLGSVTSCARQLGVSPSQVSKAIARLEYALGARLLVRTSRGVSLSEAGRALLPALDETLTRVQQLLGRAGAGTPMLTIAAPPDLCVALVPVIALALRGFRVRAVEMPSSIARTFASANAFDAAILLGRPALPETWATSEIGITRYMLLTSPQTARALGPQPIAAESLGDHCFIGPIHAVNGQLIAVADDGAAAAGPHRRGHEAQSAGAALEMAVQTGQLVFASELAARRHLEDGSLVEVRVRGWEPRQPVHLACHVDRVLARVQASIACALREVLATTSARACAPCFTE